MPLGETIPLYPYFLLAMHFAYIYLLAKVFMCFVLLFYSVLFLLL